MKLAIAAFTASLIAASSASAMYTTYDRQIDALVGTGELVSGQIVTIDVSDEVAGRNSNFTVSGEKVVTVFESANTDKSAVFQGR